MWWHLYRGEMKGQLQRSVLYHGHLWISAPDFKLTMLLSLSNASGNFQRYLEIYGARCFRVRRTKKSEIGSIWACKSHSTARWTFGPAKAHYYFVLWLNLATYRNFAAEKRMKKLPNQTDKSLWSSPVFNFYAYSDRNGFQKVVHKRESWVSSVPMF